MAYETRELQVKITGDNTSFDQAVNKTTGNVDKAGLSFGKLSLAVAAGQAIYRGAADAIGMLTDFIGQSIDAATAYQDSIMGLETGLKNSGENVAFVTEELKKQADALQLSTKFSDDQILSADAMLTTFRLQGSTIEKLAPALLDMAEGLRDADGNTISLNDAAKMMGKVMGNSADGITGLSTALRRQGVIMTEAQKNVFTYGTETERASTLTDILSYNFGGRAAAAGQTFGGKMAILNNEFEDFKKKVGLAIITALDPFIQKIMEWAQTDQAQEVIKGIVTWVGNLSTTMIKWVMDVAIPWLEKYWPGISKAIEDTWNFLQGFATFMGAFGQVVKVFYEIFIAPIVKYFQDLGAEVYYLQVFIQGVVDTIVGAFDYVINAIKSVLQWLGILNNTKTTVKVDQQVSQRLSDGSNITTSHFASGTDYAPGGMALVGEQGPELINLPRGSQVIPNNKINSMGSSVTLNVNVGMYAGMPVEKRQIALEMYKELVRAARSQGVQLPMIGAVGVQ